MVNVEIGAGDKLRVGFTPFDHRKHNYDMIFDELPYEDGSIDNIYMSHVLEHAPLFKTEEILKRLHKKLKKDGRIRIVVPDLRKLTQAYIDNDLDKFQKSYISCGGFDKHGVGGAFMNTIVSFGNDTQLFDIKKEKWIIGMAHVCSFDFEMLKSILTDVKFKDIIESSYQKEVDYNNDYFNLFVEAVK